MERVIAYGLLKLVGKKVPCAVLSNEKRVIVKREFVGLLTGTKKGNLARYLKPRNLQPYLPKSLLNRGLDHIQNVFLFGDVMAHGYTAEDIVDICDVYIQAKNDNALLPSQRRLADNAYKLIKAYAKVGLVALIDEATGYQKHRSPEALRFLAEKYIMKEAREHTKEFPDEFFIEIDGLYGNERTTSRNRPKYYGMFINKHIYKPIQNGAVFTELVRVNPTNSRGYRKKRFHQFLNEEIGLKTLKDRIAKITALLQISQNKDDFERNYRKLESKQRWFDFPEE